MFVSYKAPVSQRSILLLYVITLVNEFDYHYKFPPVVVTTRRVRRPVIEGNNLSQ